MIANHKQSDGMQPELQLHPGSQTKVCVRCHNRKDAEGFSRNKARSDGLCSYCKLCNAAAAAERRRSRVPIYVPTVTHKVCGQCRRDLAATNYHRSRNYNDGLNGKCKGCCALAVSHRKAAKEGVRRGSDESSSSGVILSLNASMKTNVAGELVRAQASGRCSRLGQPSVLGGSAAMASKQPPNGPPEEQAPQVLADVWRMSESVDGALERMRADADIRGNVPWRNTAAPNNQSSLGTASIDEGFSFRQPVGGQQQQQYAAFDFNVSLDASVGIGRKWHPDIERSVSEGGVTGAQSNYELLHKRAPFIAGFAEDSLSFNMSTPRVGAQSSHGPQVDPNMTFSAAMVLGRNLPDCHFSEGLYNSFQGTFDGRPPELACDFQRLLAPIVPLPHFTAPLPHFAPPLPQFIAPLPHAAAGTNTWQAAAHTAHGGWVGNAAMVGGGLKSCADQDALPMLAPVVGLAAQHQGNGGIYSSDASHSLARASDDSRSIAVLQRAQTAPGLSMGGVHTCEASHDCLNGMGLGAFDDSWGLQDPGQFVSRPRTVSPFSNGQGALGAYQCNQLSPFSAGFSSIDRLLGVHAPPAMLSEAATAAFPSLTDQLKSRPSLAAPHPAPAMLLMPGQRPMVPRAAP